MVTRHLLPLALALAAAVSGCYTAAELQVERDHSRQLEAALDRLEAAYRRCVESSRNKYSVKGESGLPPQHAHPSHRLPTRVRHMSYTCAQRGVPDDS